MSACLGALVLMQGTAAAQTPAGSARSASTAQSLGARIDSPPAVLRYQNRPITTFRATILSRPPAERAAAAVQRLDGLLEHANAATRVSTHEAAGGTMIAVDTSDVFGIVAEDIDTLAGETETQKVSETVGRLQQAIDETIEIRMPGRILKGLERAVGATLLFVLLMLLVLRAYQILSVRLPSSADQRVQRLAGEKADLISATRATELLRHLIAIPAITLALLLTYNWLAFVFRSFPYTRPWGESLRAFLIGRFLFLGEKVVDAVPNLFTVVIILLITRLVVRIWNRVFLAGERGTVTIPWVYPETAQPTRRIVATLLWLGGVVIAYPYLPGSSSDAFKGVSVFVGLVISLGSSSVATQVMSGLTITYSRALRRGDFVRIGDVEGTVMSVGPLSSKIRTARAEEVTIPNAVVVTQVTTNYSRYHENAGVFFGTTVAVGYDVPWRQVRALLLLAAERTESVRRTPPPVVRQLALHPSYVEYAVLVSIDPPSARAAVLDSLHANILDAFNEFDVQITSPSYEADPDSRKTVPRARWYATPAMEDAKMRDVAGV